MAKAIDAQKAADSGGLNLHPLFYLPVNNDKTNVHLMRIAEMGLQRIMKPPKVLYLLRTLDYLYIDEIEKLSSEYMTALDVILRKVRNSRFFTMVCTFKALAIMLKYHLPMHLLS
eukprot:scaffold665_cov23-Cyclotella_meneghiniana.AAC.1